MTNLRKYIAPLRRETLQQAVHDRLCTLILQGGIAPGESVTVASLAKALDVSPMPIREALSRLTAAGALAPVSGRSMGVPKLRKAEFEDIKRVRIETESIAVRWAVRQRTDEFAEHLAKLLNRLVRAEKACDNRRFIDLNYQFHFAIYEHSGSPTLLAVIRNLWLRISPYFHLLDAKGHLHVSNELHTQLLEDIVAGESAAAVRTLRRDIERAYEKLIEHTVVD